MATTGIKFDLTTFRSGLQAKRKATKIAEADILNQAGGSICANAIRLTPKATAGKIKAELSHNNLAVYATIRRLKKAGISQRGMSRARFAAEVTKTINKRAASARYIAAGWFKPLAVFRPNSKQKVSDKSLAGKSRATKATASSLAATFENHSRGASEVGAATLQQAMDEEGRSMKAYAEKKLAQAWK
jgi:hypothetical protein